MGVVIQFPVSRVANNHKCDEHDCSVPLFKRVDNSKTNNIITPKQRIVSKQPSRISLGSKHTSSYSRSEALTLLGRTSRFIGRSVR